MGVQCTPESMALGRRDVCCPEGSGMRFLGVLHMLFLANFFLLHCSLWPFLSQKAWETTCFQIQMHAPAKSFIHCWHENVSISVPGILSLRFTRRTESFKNFLSLNTDGTRSLGPFSYFLFPPPSHLICTPSGLFLIHFFPSFFLFTSSFVSYSFS